MSNARMEQVMDELSTDMESKASLTTTISTPPTGIITMDNSIINNPESTVTNEEETEELYEETPEEREKRLQLEAEIRAALNQQTIIQFRQYAQEHHPKEPHKQEELIRQLQEQHFQQYLNEVYRHQLISQREQFEQLREIYADSGEDHSLELEVPPLIPASMWTRKDIVEFKAEILKEHKECCIKIRSLETATIRVPTCAKGKYVFWEFATDGYDLGFGVYFEWSINPPDKVTVHISESSDEEEEYGEEGSGEGAPSQTGDGPEGGELGDVERRGGHRGQDDKPAMDELIPVYRRDCHQEVYCGSHRYPGQGFYVLKFDNSYSLWRSKWLYYRVYYTA